MASEPKSRPVTVTTPQITLSGLCARPEGTPRGLIVALHGGGYSAGYWDCPIGEGLSLMELGAQLGFAVLALDRPGYGASHGHDPSQLGLSSQATLLFDAVDAWRRKESFDGPVFLAGHSIGAILALMMAADARGARLRGIATLGAPLRFPPTPEGTQTVSRELQRDHVVVDAAEHNRFVFGPDDTHDREVYAYEASCRRPLPAAEYRDALVVPGVWKDVLPAINIPVQFTMAEFEVMQVTGPDALEEVRGMLSNSIGADFHLQRRTGHNASLHHIARAYHLRMIAFFEEQLAVRGRG